MNLYASLQVGSPAPLGPHFTDGGVNFALFSKHATEVVLCLIDPISKVILEEVSLTKAEHITGAIWHVFLKGLQLPILYAYRVDGPKTPVHFFDKGLLLVDPYAKMLDSPFEWGAADRLAEGFRPYGRLERERAFDWQGVTSPNYPLEELVIYEMHVKGFTESLSSKVKERGTFLGMIEKIPHLIELGVNAVELLPIFEFDESAYYHKNPHTDEPLFNFWGYSTAHFFCPMNRFATGKEGRNAKEEFQLLVRELHRNGIEVILDVVYNHTGERLDRKHTTSFAGIDRSSYYLLNHHGQDLDYSGCGNTLNTNNPVVRNLILDSLKYFVQEMHVDGFRFDLATILHRDLQGHIGHPSPLVEELSLDPVLSRVKLISEPWDCRAYQVGHFYPGFKRWSEWNGKYRDSVRKFIRGDLHSKNEFATRFTGSLDLYPHQSPVSSINFITAHDGFSLYDLVSYNKKHNLENGEHNRDGNSHNLSWNCGQEGPTDKSEIQQMRTGQMKNFLLTLLLSKGVPMILMGDEYGHTRKGNNNPWCQNNELNWFLWDELEKQRPFYRFVKELIRLRKRHPVVKKDHFPINEEILWHGPIPYQVDWNNEKPILAIELVDKEQKSQLYLGFNQTLEKVIFTFPSLDAGSKWVLLANTAAASPDDIVSTDEAAVEVFGSMELKPYSAVLLKSVST